MDKGLGSGWCGTKRQLLGWPIPFSSCPCLAAVILTVESEEEEDSDSSETEKEDDEGIIFVARATSEVLQESKVSGNGFLLPASLWSKLELHSWLPSPLLMAFTPDSHSTYLLIHSSTSIYSAFLLCQTSDISDLIQSSQQSRWQN